MRVCRPIHKRLSSPYPVPFSYAYMFTLWNKVFFRLTDLRGNNNLPLALCILAKRHNTVYIAYDRAFLWLSCFEQFGNTRQAACNYRDCIWVPLGQDITCLNLLSFFNLKFCTVYDRIYFPVPRMLIMDSNFAIPAHYYSLVP